MRILPLLTLTTLILSHQAGAEAPEAPECPAYANRQDCLASTDENLQNILQLIDDEDNGADKDRLILAAHDVKHFESQACLKTCLN